MSLVKGVPLKFSIMASSCKNRHGFQIHILSVIFSSAWDSASIGVDLYFITWCNFRWNCLLKIAGLKESLEFSFLLPTLKFSKNVLYQKKKENCQHKQIIGQFTYLINFWVSPFVSVNLIQGSLAALLTDSLCHWRAGGLPCSGWHPSEVVILRFWWCSRN